MATKQVVIEIPKHSRVKYELDPSTGRLIVDRILHTPCSYSFNYGFIENTLGGDGDPIDAVVITEEPFHPLSTVECRAIGVILTEDEKGIDDKVLLVPCKDPDMGHVHDISDLSPHLLKKITFFFENYKKMENGKWSKTKDVLPAHDAYKIIAVGESVYSLKNPKV